MHTDRALIEERIHRELYERVLGLIERDARPLTITSGPGPLEQTSFEIGDRWGPPWGTTWFEFTGAVPEPWRGQRVEAVIDLGFTTAPAGFQCEGLVVDADGRPVQGIHPRRTNVAVDATEGPVVLRVEAASNPSFPEFRPSQLGSLSGAHDRPLYRFRRADLTLVDTEAEALAHDLDVLNGVMLARADLDPRRARMLAALADALDHLPDVAAARAVLRPWLTAAGPPGSAGHRVIATGHAHIDTAWLWPIRETIRKCTRTFASAVRLMDDRPDFRFSCSQAQQYAWIEQHQPDLFDRIKVKVAAGQWVPVGGMWVEADMNLPSGESLARQIVFGQRYFEQRFGRRCTEVWIPDVFGYPAAMPQLYAQGGMRRFVTQKLSWNTTNRFPHHTFHWEGLDGTRVLTHFPPVDTYNAEITSAEVMRSASRFLDAGWSDWSLMPFGYGDGGGGPTREMLERADRLAAVDDVPSIAIGSPSEFFELVEAEEAAGAQVPVWRGELYFETHRGTLTSQLRTKMGNRRCERLLREIELWSATAGRAADVDEQWREVLTQQFHDIIPGSSIAWVHADAEAVHTRVGATLEDRIRTELRGLTPAGLHIANAAGVDRDEIIEIDGDPVRVVVAAHGFAPVAPTDPVTGVDDRVVVEGSSMHNGHLRASWNDSGHLVSLVDLAADRDVIPSRRAAAVLEIAPDRPVRYDAWDLESWTPGLAEPVGQAESIEIAASGPMLGRVSITYRFGPSAATVTYTMRAGSRRLDIGVDLDWQHDEHLLSMAFPLDVRAETAACHTQFGHVKRPTHPSNSWDAAKFEVCAHRFVDLSEPGFGVAVLNDGRYGHGVFGGGVRVSLARAARYPDPDADRGRHAVDLALLPHDAGLAEVVAEAERFTMPLRVVDGTADEAPVPIVAIDGPGIEIDAVKSADDDPRDLVVRFHEAIGDRTRIIVRGDRPFLRAERCWLTEEPHEHHALAQPELTDGVLTMTVMPFEIVTLRLTR